MNSFFENQTMDYVKFILYGTTDKKEIEKKDQALKDMFNGIQETAKENFSHAQKFLENSMDMYKKSHDQMSLALSQFFIAENYRVQDNSEQAINFYKKAYDIFKEQGNKMALEVEKKIQDLEKLVTTN